MKIKRKKISNGAINLLIIFSIIVIAGIIIKLVICSNYTVRTEKVAEQLSSRFKLDINTISVSTVADIDSLYEIVLKDSGEVFYSDKNGEYLILGRLIDKDGKDLTLAKEEELSKQGVSDLLSSIDYSKAIKVGNGEVEIIEFTDVECPYCLKAEGFFDDSLVTRYIYLSPMNPNNTISIDKSIHILCSDNKTNAYRDILSGSITELKTCAKGEQLLNEHLEYASASSVRGTPHFIFPADKSTIIGADPKILDKIKSLGNQ